MKIILGFTFIFFIVFITWALFNLYILFEVGNCHCISCTGECVSTIDFSEKYSCVSKSLNKGPNLCARHSCHQFFGKCYKTSKYLEFNYYIRGR